MPAKVTRFISLPKKFNGHVQGLFLQVRRSIRAYRNSYDREAVHQLRLAIKRLRQVYMLRQQGVAGLKGLPDAAPFEELFRKAGGLRDLHIQLGLIDGWKPIGSNRLDELVNEWKRAERKKRSGFLRACKGRGEPFFRKVTRQVAAACLSLDEAELRKGITELFRLQYSRLLVFPRDGDRHRLRTLVKNTRYAIELLVLCRPRPALPAKIDRHLQRIQKPLGLWHDAVVGLQRMELCLLEIIQVPLAATREYLGYQKHLRGLLRAHLEEFKRHWEAFRADPQARDLRLPTAVAASAKRSRRTRIRS